MKFSILIVILFVTISFIGGFFISQNLEEKKGLNIPSKCYTNLESSSFLATRTPSPIIINKIQDYVKIEIKDRDFFFMQTAGTGSMRPFLQKASSVILIKPKIEDIKVGDVITFDCNDMNVIHRVIKIENGIYTTKGDNNNIGDTKCVTKFEDITGRVVGVLY